MLREEKNQEKKGKKKRKTRANNREVNMGKRKQCCVNKQISGIRRDPCLNISKESSITKERDI